MSGSESGRCEFECEYECECEHAYEYAYECEYQYCDCFVAALYLLLNGFVTSHVTHRSSGFSASSSTSKRTIDSSKTPRIPSNATSARAAPRR